MNDYKFIKINCLGRYKLDMNIFSNVQIKLKKKKGFFNFTLKITEL